MEVAEGQPSTFNPDKLGSSDNLFSGTSLRVIRASNVRDKERLIHMSRCVESAKRSTQGEYEYYKKAMRRRSSQIQARMEELDKQKTRERDTVTAAHKLVETPDSVFLPGAAGGEQTTARRPGWGRLRSNLLPTVGFAQHMSNLGYLPPSSRGSSQTETVEVTGADGHVFIITGNRRPTLSQDSGDSARRLSQSYPAPAPQSSHPAAPPGLGGGAAVSGGLRRGANRRSTVIDTEELKRLVLRLHREDTSVTDPGQMSDEERRIYDFIQRTLPVNAPPGGGLGGSGGGRPGEMRRPRANTRIYHEDPLRRLSMALGVDLDNVHEAPAPALTQAERRRRYLLQMNINPITLPPVHTLKTRKLRNRDAEWDTSEPTRTPKTLSHRQWEDMKYCRYLRSPAKKFHPAGTDAE